MFIHFKLLLIPIFLLDCSHLAKLDQPLALLLQIVHLILIDHFLSEEFNSLPLDVRTALVLKFKIILLKLLWIFQSEISVKVVIISNEILVILGRCVVIDTFQAP